MYTARNNWDINIRSSDEQHGKQHLSVGSAPDQTTFDFKKEDRKEPRLSENGKMDKNA